jgi:hypothetical protein
MGEIAVTIRAVNEATPEFEAVASDAARMASDVGAQAVIIHTENLASPEINRVAEDAARVKAEVEGSPVTIAFAPVEVPTIPAVEIPPIQTSFAPVEVPTIPPIESPTVTVNFAPIDVPVLPSLDTSPIEDSLNRVTAAAISMSSTVSAQSITIQAQDLASPEISKVADTAASVKASIEAAPITISFALIEAPPLPPLDTTPIQASLNEVGVAATGMGVDVEAASTSFDDMSAHAEATMVSLRTVAGGIRSTAMMGTELTTLAADFGLVDKETSKYLRTIMLMIMIVSTAARMYNFLTVMTTGQTAAVAIETTTETGATAAETSHSIAHGIYAAACNIATMAENALNISHATFLALTGVGIGVIIAAAAAVSIFASQMNSATASVKGYNTAASETPAKMAGITRAGEQAMYRRGVE